MADKESPMTAGDGASTSPDESVVRALYAEHGGALFAHSLRLAGGDLRRAEVLVRETLVRAWWHANVLDLERGSVRTRLLTTAQHLSIVAWCGSRAPEVIIEALPGPAGTYGADRVVEAFILAEAIKQLKPIHREALIECFYRGRSVADAAARLGVPPGTVKARTHYAMRALRLSLTEVAGSNHSWQSNSGRPRPNQSADLQKAGRVP
jgi:RNA polymerase sigma-70 factor (ECF subfamily)